MMPPPINKPEKKHTITLTTIAVLNCSAEYLLPPSVALVGFKLDIAENAFAQGDALKFSSDTASNSAHNTFWLPQWNTIDDHFNAFTVEVLKLESNGG